MSIKALFQNQKVNSLLLRKSTVKERKQLLKKLGQWIAKNGDEIEQAVNKDFNKPLMEVSVTEIYPIQMELQHTIKHLKKWMRKKRVDTPIQMLGTSAYIQYEPKGCALIISPWNYPFSLAVGPLIAAVAAGCTFILKPSECTPTVSNLLVKMVKAVFPENIGAVVEGGKEAAQELLTLPFNHIFFTGSTAIGKVVMKAASEHLASVTLELGGKSPVFIDATANLKAAAKKIAWGKMVNGGQSCIAPDYVLVEEKVKEDFLKFYIAALHTIYPDLEKGKANKDIASIVNKGHFERLESYKKAESAPFYGKGSIETERFVYPHIFEELAIDAPMMAQEIFGPLLPILTYKNLAEAIEIVNEKDKPLSMYVFSNSKSTRKKLLTEVSAGGAVVNDVLIQFAHTELPFGGVNQSGIGKAHGHAGFLAFSNQKSVLTQHFSLGSTTLLYPPYTPAKRRILKFFMKFF